ncbi:MAG: tellurite resistance TerB family protein [Rhizobiales bacterium]|nr:tellurite resistance TerB family protein [Hyphomicrobiales bacterium]
MSVQQLLDQFLGGNQGGEPAAQQSPANGLAAKAGGMLQSIPGGLAGGVAAGSLLGLVAGNKKIRKTAGKLAGGAVGIGGAAALGALAFKAYQSWQGAGPASAGGSATAPVGETGLPIRALEPENFAPENQVAASGDLFPVALIKAMIAAANADGHIDGEEQAAIFAKVEEMQLDAQDKALVFDTLQNPPSVQEVASLAHGIEQACEIYLVSRMAIDPDHPREQVYLQELAGHLSLPDGLAVQLDRQLAQPAPLAA